MIAARNEQRGLHSPDRLSHHDNDVRPAVTRSRLFARAQLQFEERTPEAFVRQDRHERGVVADREEVCR